MNYGVLYNCLNKGPDAGLYLIPQVLGDKLEGAVRALDEAEALQESARAKAADVDTAIAVRFGLHGGTGRLFLRLTLCLDRVDISGDNYLPAGIACPLSILLLLSSFLFLSPFFPLPFLVLSSFFLICSLARLFLVFS